MISESITSPLSPIELTERLKIAMTAQNFEVHEPTPNEISFRRWGARYSSTSPSRPKRGEFPKRGQILIRPSGNGSHIDYEIEVYGIIKYWLILNAVIFCWLIFPPILIFRALSNQPRQLMRNLLQEFAS